MRLFTAVLIRLFDADSRSGVAVRKWKLLQCKNKNFDAEKKSSVQNKIATRAKREFLHEQDKILIAEVAKFCLKKTKLLYKQNQIAVRKKLGIPAARM